MVLVANICKLVSTTAEWIIYLTKCSAWFDITIGSNPFRVFVKSCDVIVKSDVIL